MTRRKSVRQNHHARLVADEHEREKQRKEKFERREAIQKKAKKELLLKLGLEADDLEVDNEKVLSLVKQKADTSGDVEMKPVKGVKRTITKDKDKARTKRALKLAKARPDIDFAEARKILFGKEKRKKAVTPLGKATRHEKKLHDRREKRLRKMGWDEKSDSGGEDDENAEG
mmetsp:Transcript_52240/g.122254  ORF Transcript_52240/g.122254 Transcript_52240/m.122254 type:complete len:172 (+) Transcript_52240:61-576(+)